ncbi:MAG: FAD-binding oxidoreductase [Candidatus Eisenbacteria bacterium]
MHNDGSGGLDHPGLVTDPDVCRGYAADASGLSHTPDAVARPGSEDEIVALVRHCAGHGLSITAQGLRSSTTGSSVPESGIALSLEKLDRILEIDPKRMCVRVQSGVVLGDLKRRLAEQGLFYPPDPTSENECTIGGTVATNASGSRTYRYGATRGYVRALRVVFAAGTVRDIRGCLANKNAAGYAGLQNPVDPFIGSEGTLGIVTETELALLPKPVGFVAGFAYFPGWRQAISFIQSADAARREGRLAPRCLELFDEGALALVAGRNEGLRVPAAAGSAVFFEEETADAIETLEHWIPIIEGAGGYPDETRIASTEAEQSELRRLRHAIPATMNERGAQAVRAGGRKVSTDFAVPLADLPEMMETAYRIAGEIFGGEVIAYGHAGNGHPHFNLLAPDPEALAKAQVAARAMAERALALGGTLSAEHGIGKLKAPLFRDLYPEWVQRGMRALKTSFDPMGLFAPGNLFD